MKYILPEAHDHLNFRQFELAVRKLANSLGYGSDPSPFLGSGIDYVQSRPYIAGDPLKQMDWRVTARTGKFHVKEYQAPKQMPVYIVLDTSASMCVSSLKQSKYAAGVQIACGLGLVAQERMSPVGLLGAGERELHIKPSLSKARLMQWAHSLRRFDYKESTNLGSKLRTLMPSLKERAVIIVISDFHDETAMHSLKLLAQEHDVVAIEMQDPAEKGNLKGGFFRAGEAESEMCYISTGRDKFFDVEERGRQLSKGHVDHLLISTAKPFLPKLRNFLAGRSCFGRGTR